MDIHPLDRFKFKIPVWFLRSMAEAFKDCGPDEYVEAYAGTGWYMAGWAIEREGGNLPRKYDVGELFGYIKPEATDDTPPRLAEDSGRDGGALPEHRDLGPDQSV